MESLTRAQLIDLYVGKIQSGEMEFSQLKAELNKRKLPPEEVTLIVRFVDDQLIKAKN